MVSPVLDTLAVGETAQFTATTYDTLGQPVTGVAVSWISGDTKIFTVTLSGRVRGVE